MLTEMAISKFRTGLTNVVDRVRVRREMVVVRDHSILTSALVPLELAQLAEQLGGADKAIAVLRLLVTEAA
jgi:hypothetical protein